MEGAFFGFGLLFIVGIALTAVSIWGIVDAASIPDPAWEAAGQNKTLWVALQAVGLLVCLGFLITIYYFAAIRPQVRGRA